MNLKIFNIVKNLICSDSKYFHKICFGKWAKTRDADEPIRVIGQSPEIFSIFVTYVHHRDILLAEHFPEVTTEASRDKAQRLLEYDMRFIQLIKCHILGRYLMADGFW